MSGTNRDLLVRLFGHGHIPEDFNLVTPKVSQQNKESMVLVY